MDNVRVKEAGPEASSRLGNLHLNHRAQSLLKHFEMADQEVDNDEDAVDHGTSHLRRYGSPHPGSTGRLPGAASKAVDRSPRLRAAGAESRRMGARVRDGRAAMRTERSSRAVRGGLMGRRRAAASKSTVRAGKAAQAASQRISQAATALVNAVRSMVSAIVVTFSSAPTTLIIVAVVAIIAIIISIFAIFVPAMQQVQNQNGGISNFGLVDDYPYKGQYSTSAMSPLGYAYGNCTDFVAWRMNRDAGVLHAPWKYTWSALTPEGGNGADWGKPGNLPGWVTTRTPVPGDVISVDRAGILTASTSDIGHVAYVGAVDSTGTVTIENYGLGHYYLTSATISQLDQWIDDGYIVIKHNPAGRVGGSGVGDANGAAQSYALSALGSDMNQFQCLNQLWLGESGWNPKAENPSSGAYGIPQALPGKKMASAGADWATNPITQVRWGLGYIRDRYGTPCQAWAFWQGNNPHWY